MEKDTVKCSRCGDLIYLARGNTGVRLKKAVEECARIDAEQTHD